MAIVKDISRNKYYMNCNYLKEDFIDNEDAIETIEETSSSDDYSDISSAEWYSSCYDSDKNFNVMFNVLFNASGSFMKDSRKIEEIERKAREAAEAAAAAEAARTGQPVDVPVYYTGGTFQWPVSRLRIVRPGPFVALFEKFF